MIANVYGIVAPFVMLLIAAEVAYCLVRRNGYYSFQDSLIGLGTMFIAQCANVAVSVAVVFAYGWIYENYALFRFEPTWWHYVVCYVAVDFLFYWFHRAGHRVNLFWAAHVPHHSAEELNYAVALRASLTQRAFSFLFYWPLAVLGFAPEVILPIVAINLVYQLLPHTQVIGRFPRWIESWLNTPYHHRMHHALNPIYWDKNYGGTFIVWDKLFGTYCDETEKPYYGVSIHPRSWDPTILNFHWFGVAWRDMLAARTWGDRLRVWYKPPGWRPVGLAPFPKTDDLAARPKYRTECSPALRLYLLAQVLPTFALVLWILGGQAHLSVADSLLLTVAIWWSVTGWAALLEARAWAVDSELARHAATAAIVAMLVLAHALPMAWIGAATAVSAAQIAWVWFGLRAARLADRPASFTSST